MNVGQAIAALGVDIPAGLDLVLVHPNSSGLWEHHTFETYRNHEINGDIYLASGAFAKGIIQMYSGRSRENVSRVLWLPFDFDLSDYMQTDKEWLYSLTDEELWPLIEGMRIDVEEVFSILGLPIHRIDYTGYGLAAYINLPPHKPNAVAAIVDLHGAIVDRINEIAKIPLADVGVRDAGSRIMRLVPCLNTKGPIPRQTRTIYQTDVPKVDRAMLQAAAGQTTTPPERMIPRGKNLDPATVDLIVSHVSEHWIEGKRHRIALGLCGMLAKAGVPEEQADTIIERLGDDQRFRRMSVTTTYNRLRSGLDVKGFYALKDALPEALIQWLDVELVKLHRGPVLVVGGEKPKEKKPDIADIPLPDICYTGWFKEYVDLSTPLCEAPPEFHIASSMALMGATLGRSVATRYVSKNVYANMYLMLVGLAGTSRKDTAIELALDLPNVRIPGSSTIRAPAFSLRTDVGSPQGLIKALCDNPNTLLYITEYQRLVGNARRQSTSNIFPLLTTAWNAPVAIENVTIGDPLRAMFPCLSIIAAVQPGILAQEMTQEDIQSGYATRWLYVTGRGRGAIADPPEIDPTSAHMLYQDILDIKRIYDSVEGGTKIILSKRARDIWSDWYDQDRKREVLGDDEASMQSRLAVHVRKVALLYAAGEGQMEIDVHHLEPAIAFVEWCWEQTKAMMKLWGANIWNHLEAKIEEVLKAHGELTRKKLAYLCRSRRWGAREFAQVLEAMVKNGTVLIPAPGLVAWDHS